MINTELLNQYIQDSGLKRKHIASRLGITAYGLANKINNRTSFTAKEIAVLAELLCIPQDDVFSIFLSVE